MSRKTLPGSPLLARRVFADAETGGSLKQGFHQPISLLDLRPQLGVLLGIVTTARDLLPQRLLYEPRQGHPASGRFRLGFSVRGFLDSQGRLHTIRLQLSFFSVK